MYRLPRFRRAVVVMGVKMAAGRRRAPETGLAMAPPLDISARGGGRLALAGATKMIVARRSP